MQMYMIMDALADGGVYAGVPKDLALKLTAYTMMVSIIGSTDQSVVTELCVLLYRVQPKWSWKMETIPKR